MTGKQPEALRLVEMLAAEEWPGNVTVVSYARECVAELIRQHACIAELQAQLAQRLDAAAQAVVSAGPTEAEIVFAAVASGDWKITRNQPSGYMTDEGNARTAWTAERANAPYCVDLGPGKGRGNRHWSAATAIGALQAASKEMGIALPAPATQQAGEMEVFGLQWPGEDRINLSTVFDTETEALGYMQNRCDTPGIRLVRFSSNAPTAQAAESVPAVEREQERIAFKDAHRHLELYEVPDAWGRPMFKHSHVEASWLGWIARASHGQARADSAQEDVARLDFLIDQRAYVVSDPDACPGHWLHWARPDGSTWVQVDEHPTPRAAIDAARKQGVSHDR